MSQSADMDRMSLSAWPERRPPRTESDRAYIAARLSVHLPKTAGPIKISDLDAEAMKAAFIRRFDEQLPRTETLFAVANVGYRMALRDLAQAMSTGTAETAEQAQGRSPASAVPEGQAPE